MRNKVFVNNHGVIECHVIGDQTLESITKMGQEIMAHLTELKAQHKPLLILDDITEIGKVPAEGRNAVVELTKKLQYNRLAMYGKNGLIRVGANLIFRASGRSKKLKYFTNYSEAMSWLLAR